MDIIKTSDPAKLLDKLLKTLPSLVTVPRNAELIVSFIRDARLGKTVLKGSKKKIGTSACYKYVLLLKHMDSFWQKPFDGVTVPDMERLIEALESDAFVSRKGTPYTAESKHDYKKTVRKFFRWLHKADFPDGDAGIYARLTYWIDDTTPRNEVEALSREQVQKLADGAKLRDKVAIWMLFDSGARAEEFLNLRIADLEKKDGYYTVRIRHETSKTTGRTVDLSMTETIKLLTSWLQTHPASASAGIPPEAQIVPISYDQLRKQLGNLAKRLLNRKVTPLTMRHSSATHWAGKLSQYQLCQRFGWSMTSDMPQRYIDRAGVAAKQTAHIERADRLSEVARENEDLKEEMARLKAQMDSIGKLMGGLDLEELRQKAAVAQRASIDFITRLLQGGKGSGNIPETARDALVRALDALQKSKV